MKKYKNLITIIVGVVVVVTLGLFLVYNAIENNSRKLEQFIIAEVGKDVESSETLKVNKLVYASRKMVIKELSLEVKHGKLYINDKLKYIDDDDILFVTGYYYQPGDTYYLYVLTDDDEVYSLTDVYYDEVFKNDFREYEYYDEELDDVDRLILVDVSVTDEMVGELSEKYRVYAQVRNNIIRLR